MTFRVPHSLYESVTLALTAGLRGTSKRNDQAFDPFIRYHTFGDSSVNFTVILRVKEFTDRYLVTHDNLIIMASETGVLNIKPEDVKQKGRLQPGKMLLVDTVEGRIVGDRELKSRLYGRKPYQLWIKENQKRSSPTAA